MDATCLDLAREAGNAQKWFERGSFGRGLISMGMAAVCGRLLQQGRTTHAMVISCLEISSLTAVFVRIRHQQARAIEAWNNSEGQPITKVISLEQIPYFPFHKANHISGIQIDPGVSKPSSKLWIAGGKGLCWAALATAVASVCGGIVAGLGLALPGRDHWVRPAQIIFLQGFSMALGMVYLGVGIGSVGMRLDKHGQAGAASKQT